MYRLGSRMLIIVLCVMAMVRALPVNTEMVIWILTGADYDKSCGLSYMDAM